VDNTVARTIPFAAPFGADLPALHGSILLVEDESFVREVTAEILETAGYHVFKARSAVEAVREFKKHQTEIALLLVDVVLPGRSGCDVVKDLKRQAPTLKTIFISGYPQNRAYMNQDASDQTIYLPKPFSVGSLMQKIRDVVATG
jgi:two-component system cell cycle sensor histidine kinase/response regulator CckA